MIPHPVPDVQAAPDHRDLPIQQVGIRGIRHPVRVRSEAGAVQTGVATWSMYVHLAASQKGTHMSRFIELLGVEEVEVSAQGLHRLAADMMERLGSEQAYIELAFPYFIRKAAPVSGALSLLDYEVTLTATRCAGNSDVRLRVVVPVTSLCPCSKTISRYGAHNQRSHVTVEIPGGEGLWIEELVRLIEQESSCELYALLKRADEQWITERAYDNPKFVEDVVRDIAAKLDQDKRVSGYRVSCENFESIHNHSAYAVIEAG